MADQSEKFSGKVKETTGKVTGDDQLESEGRTQRSKEESKEKMEEVRDKAKGAMDAIKDKS
jgi:uncharacterized protein YjbJ (UPF0337 family)